MQVARRRGHNEGGARAVQLGAGGSAKGPQRRAAREGGVEVGAA